MVTIIIAFIQRMSIPYSQIEIVHSQMVLERYFAIQFTYIQWAIIPMIDGTINNCLLAFDFGLGTSSSHHRLT